MCWGWCGSFSTLCRSSTARSDHTHIRISQRLPWALVLCLVFFPIVLMTGAKFQGRKHEHKHTTDLKTHSILDLS